MPIPVEMAFIGQLIAARVAVAVAGGEATVTADYRVEGSDSVGLVLIRLPNQKVTSLNAGSSRTEQLDGLTRVVVQPGEGGTIEVRYVVEGDLSRIPIPVPSVPSNPLSKSVEIRVRGLDPTIRPEDAFPRFRADSSGAVAVLANVPSVIRIPRAGGWPITRLLDGFVFVLVAGSSLFWFIRFRSGATRSSSTQS